MSVFTRICTGLLISALSLTVHAAGSDGQNPDQQAPVASVDVSDTREVIQVLYVGNASEIKVADLIRERNPDESLRMLADEIARDHAWMNRLLATIANIKSIGLDDAELSDAAQLVSTQLDEGIQMLAAKPEEEFRGAVLEALIMEHQKTLELYNRIEAATTDDALKATIAVFRQLVEKHLSEAQKLQMPAQPEQPIE